MAGWANPSTSLLTNEKRAAQNDQLRWFHSTIHSFNTHSFQHLLTARHSSLGLKWSGRPSKEKHHLSQSSYWNLCTSDTLATVSASATWADLDMSHIVWNQTQLSMYQVPIFCQIISFELCFFSEPTSLLAFLKPSSFIYKIRDETRYTRKIPTKRKAKSMINNKETHYLMVKINSLRKK